MMPQSTKRSFSKCGYGATKKSNSNKSSGPSSLSVTIIWLLFLRGFNKTNSFIVQHHPIPSLSSVRTNGLFLTPSEHFLFGRVPHKSDMFYHNSIIINMRIGKEDDDDAGAGDEIKKGRKSNSNHNKNQPKSKKKNRQKKNTNTPEKINAPSLISSRKISRSTKQASRQDASDDKDNVPRDMAGPSSLLPPLPPLFATDRDNSRDTSSSVDKNPTSKDTSANSSFNKSSSSRRNRDRQKNSKPNNKDDAVRIESLFSSFPNSSKGIPTSFSSSLPPSLDGVLPVSELFYRSSPQKSSMPATNTNNVGGGDNDDDEEEEDAGSDDEELPFSAEQTNRISSEGNKIQIRRNMQPQQQQQQDQGRPHLQAPPSLLGNNTPPTKKDHTTKESKKKDKPKKPSPKIAGNNARVGRKMVRRGMEMLVGGEPINADPPLRFVELTFDQHAEDWANVITLNSRDFGPLLHLPSASKVSYVSRGLYCEHFVAAALKWEVCPEDLKNLTEEYQHLSKENHAKKRDGGVDDLSSSYSDLVDQMITLTDEVPVVAKENDQNVDGRPKTSKNVGDRPNKYSNSKIKENMKGKGFGVAATTPVPPKKGKKKVGGANSRLSSSSYAGRRVKTMLRDELDGGELKFTLGVNAADLEVPDKDGDTKAVLSRIVARGIANAIKCGNFGFIVLLKQLHLSELEVGITHVSVKFSLVSQHKKERKLLKKQASDINQALSDAVNSGTMSLALAASVKEDPNWDEDLKTTVIEELLFEVDNGDEPIPQDDEDTGTGPDDNHLSKGSGDKKEVDSMKQEVNGFINDVINLHSVASAPQSSPSDKMTDGRQGTVEDGASLDDVPFGLPGSFNYDPDDLYLGGGNGGVFFDYSEKNIISSPYSGDLGPLLVDGVVERAIQRQPRVIAIGDVHGCLDELQALLRRCDYRPGDLVVFLGDLVSKGPDSLSVVQMAREIGALGVRGNHDFEVIRWHQAIMSGADPPVIGSEHFHIASGLSKADLKWLYSLPWYLSSKELGALFVHAGFVSGIRLAKQNPRLMMNMRSILPDGTVTSKFFNNWPWARLWDGPQTVLFGHDADRGLQQYEHAIGLDTGCVYGGRLTACILPEKRLVSVSAKKEYFQYRRKHFD